MVRGRFGFLFVLALARGCGSGRPVASTDCATEPACTSDPESTTAMAATATEAGGAEPSGPPGRLVDAIEQTESSAAPTLSDSPDSIVADSLETSSDSFQWDFVDSQRIEPDGWVRVPDESLFEPSDSSGVADGLLESIGFRSEDIPELLSLTLDGMLLEPLGVGSSSSPLDPSIDAIPGRFPTYLELLCREEGYSDSFCRRRYGF